MYGPESPLLQCPGQVLEDTVADILKIAGGAPGLTIKIQRSTPSGQRIEYDLIATGTFLFRSVRSRISCRTSLITAESDRFGLVRPELVDNQLDISLGRRGMGWYRMDIRGYCLTEMLGICMIYSQ